MDGLELMSDCTSFRSGMMQPGVPESHGFDLPGLETRGGVPERGLLGPLQHAGAGGPLLCGPARGAGSGPGGQHGYPGGQRQGPLWQQQGILRHDQADQKLLPGQKPQGPAIHHRPDRRRQLLRLHVHPDVLWQLGPGQHPLLQAENPRQQVEVDRVRPGLRAVPQRL